MTEGGKCVLGENIEIDVMQEEQATAGNVQLPLNFITIGEIESDDVKVYIKQDIYKRIEKYSHADTSKELGSILLGDYCEELGKTHVVISEFIEAKYTDASASTLTFTHETWDYVHSEQDKLYPSLRMLGWQHTHPNYGVFLSNYDMFIQENFFNMAYQIAFVVDPIQGLRGFFQWKNGKVEKLKGFYVFDDVGKPIKIEQTTSSVKGKKSETMSNKSIIVLSTLLALLVIAFVVSFVTLNKMIQDQFEQQKMLEPVIASQSADIQALQETISDSEGETVSLEELIARLEAQQIMLDNQGEIIENLQGLLKDTIESDNLAVYTSYTVQKGDTLSRICEKHGISYWGNARNILALNGIANENLIYVGQIIILPAANVSE